MIVVTIGHVHPAAGDPGRDRGDDPFVHPRDERLRHAGAARSPTATLLLTVTLNWLGVAATGADAKPTLKYHGAIREHQTHRKRLGREHLCSHT